MDNPEIDVRIGYSKYYLWPHSVTLFEEGRMVVSSSGWTLREAWESAFAHVLEIQAHPELWDLPHSNV